MLDVVYCHLHQVSVVEHDLVHSGSVLGSVGKSGRTDASYPAHLHVAFLREDTRSVIVPPQGGTPTDLRRIKQQFIDPKYLLGSKSGLLKVSDQPSALHPDVPVFAPFVHKE